MGRGVMGDKGAEAADNVLVALLDALPLTVMGIGLEGAVLYLNRRARRLYAPGEAAAGGVVSYRDLEPEGWRQFQAAIATREPVLGIRLRRGEREYLASWLPVISAGKLQMVLHTLLDLAACDAGSHMFPAYEKLARQLDAIMEASYDGICITDASSRILKANAAFGKITGVGVEEMIGQEARELVKKRYFDESVSMKVIGGKRRVTMTQRYPRTGKEGLVTGTPIRGDDGEIVMCVTNIRDMTDLQELNRRLEDTLGMARDYKKRLHAVENSRQNTGLVMQSAAMRAVAELLERISGTDATVLVCGETGVGKEKIAEEIHARSARGETGIFVKINCGAIPETLLESELFGYEKGAFTGAHQHGKIGLFELADGGTLFLDEIGSLPFVLQSKLLRVLQNFEITRLGGTVPKKVNVRLICASNEDLKELIASHRFRSDLYYRLNVVPLVVPPLRERREDILPLLNLFLSYFNNKYGKAKTISKGAADYLLRYVWPGNVRELENLVERLVIITPGDIIQPADLPVEFLPGSQPGAMPPGTSLPKHLQRLERAIIEDAVKIHGNARRAAAHLGIDPSTVTRKLKKHRA